MSAPDHNAPVTEPTRRGRLPVRTAAAAVRWATASKRRMAMAGAAGLVVLTSVFAAWSYVAHLAVESLKPATIEMALDAMDAGKFEDAKSIVVGMQSRVATPELVGGAMFVLGALKVREAEQELSDERRSAAYQLAARYFHQAHEQGVPHGREAQAAYLLGKSLVNGGQPEAGVARLEEALSLHAEPAVEIHALLVRALLAAPEPDLKAALAHNEFVIGDAALVGDRRDEAWLQRAETLLRLGRLDDALAALAQVSRDGAYEGQRTMLLGRSAMVAAKALPADSGERTAKLDNAVELFQAAQKLDFENGSLSRQSIYWTARCFELRGDHGAAQVQYRRLSNLYGDTEEGLAASLAEADYARLAATPSRRSRVIARCCRPSGIPKRTTMHCCRSKSFASG